MYWGGLATSLGAIKSNATAVLGNRRMEWDHGVSPVVAAARQADIPHDAYEPTTGHQHAERFAPHLVDLAEELVVVG